MLEKAVDQTYTMVIVGSCQYKEISDVSPYGFIRNTTDKTGRGGGYLYMLGGGCEERQNGQRRCEKKHRNELQKVR